MLKSPPSGITVFLGRLLPTPVLVFRAASGLTRVFSIFPLHFLTFITWLGSYFTGGKAAVA